MKKKREIPLLILWVLLGLQSCGVVNHVPESPLPESSYKDPSYFVPMEITHWTKDQFPTPCLAIQIENQIITSSLDLGFKGFFSMASQRLEKIEKKTYLGSLKRYGFRGKEYEKAVFEVPKIRVGRMTFSQMPVLEDAKDFYINSAMGQPMDPSCATEEARIGWQVCQLGRNLLLDLSNRCMAFCDSVETFEREGYQVSSFIKTPLLSDRAFIELMAATSKGPLRCVLDTGCTWKCFHVARKEGEAVEDVICNPVNIWEVEHFHFHSEKVATEGLLRNH